MSFDVLIHNYFSKEESFSKQHRRQYFTARVVLERVGLCQPLPGRTNTSGEAGDDSRTDRSSCRGRLEFRMDMQIMYVCNSTTQSLLEHSIIVLNILLVHFSVLFIDCMCVSDLSICITGGGPFVSRGDQV